MLKISGALSELQEKDVQIIVQSRQPKCKRSLIVKEFLLKFIFVSLAVTSGITEREREEQTFITFISAVLTSCSYPHSMCNKKLK